MLERLNVNHYDGLILPMLVYYRSTHTIVIDIPEKLQISLQKTTFSFHQIWNKNMAQPNTAQDVMRCDLCETVIAQMYCEFCHVKLCKGCIGEHVSSDLTKPHTLTGFYERRSSPVLPKCSLHNKKTCEIHCKECDSPLCADCVIFHQQRTHEFQNIMDIYKSKQKEIEKNLEYLENTLCLKCEKIASEVKTEKENLDKEYSKLKTAISEHGEDWHNAINILVNNMKSKVYEMKTQHLQAVKEEQK